MIETTAPARALPELADPLRTLDRLGVIPVRALLRLTVPGSPRWAFSTFAADLAGPWRRVPAVGAQLLELGLPALPERPRRVLKDRTSVGNVYADDPSGARLPAQVAVPPLKRLVDQLEADDVLVALVVALDGLAETSKVSSAPDAPDGWVTENWAPMRSLMGDWCPPLRWAAPPKVGRPELAALRRAVEVRDPVLVGIPRAASPAERHVDGLEGPQAPVIASDARLLAVRALVAHARRVGATVENNDVRALVSWVVGPTRGGTTLAARSSQWGSYLATVGGQYADRQLRLASPADVAELLLSEAGAGVSVA